MTKANHKKAEFVHKTIGGPLARIYLPHPAAWVHIPEPELDIPMPHGVYRRGDGPPYTYTWRDL